MQYCCYFLSFLFYTSPFCVGLLCWTFTFYFVVFFWRSTRECIQNLKNKEKTIDFCDILNFIIAAWFNLQEHGKFCHAFATQWQHQGQKGHTEPIKLGVSQKLLSITRVALFVVLLSLFAYHSCHNTRK